MRESHYYNNQYRLDKKENDENFNRRRINSRIRNVCIPVDIPNYNIRETMSKKHNET